MVERPTYFPSGECKVSSVPKKAWAAAGYQVPTTWMTYLLNGTGWFATATHAVGLSA